MKRLLIASITLNCVLIAGATLFMARRIRAQKPSLAFSTTGLYQSRVSAFEAMPAHKSAIIFAGDSITEFCRWGELLQRADVLNRGISGDRISGLESRIPEIARHKPTHLFVMVGINDLLLDNATLPQVSESYRSLLTAIQRAMPGTSVTMEAVLPTNPTLIDEPTLNTRIAEANSSLSRLADSFGYRFLDAGVGLVETDGRLSGKYTSDGAHLNGAGYIQLRNAIIGFIPSPSR